MDPQIPSAPTSIHHRRRWFYVLWSLLLISSLVLLALWRIPGSKGQATLTVNLTLKGLPTGTRMQVWAGPSAQWPEDQWKGEGARLDRQVSGEDVNTGPMQLELAYRRWQKVYIPERTVDLVVFKVLPLQGSPKYFYISLKEDINAGSLRPKGRLSYQIKSNWQTLATSAHPTAGGVCNP